MGTIRNDSLKQRSARDLPAPKTTRGNYAGSALRALCVEIQGGAIQSEPIKPGETLWALLFTQDVPIILEARSYYDASTVPSLNPTADYDEEIILNGNFAGNPVLTVSDPTTSPADLMKQLTGVTDGAGLPVQGYLTTLTVRGRGIQGPGGQLDPVIRIKALCASPVIWGSVAGFEDVPYTPVILDEKNYTQAIQDANNTYTDAFGAVYQVVGIFGVTA